MNSNMSISIRWLGHAGFRVAFPDPEDNSVERVVYIDTWLANPKTPADIKGTVPDDADLCLVTHGHFDHQTSTPDLIKASKKGAKGVSNFEITMFWTKFCGLTEQQVEKMNKGGTIDFKYCKVTMTTADHSSCCLSPEGHIEVGGDPGGFVLHIPHLNARIYHGGDTNVFMDMQLIHELYAPNILMIPIGDRFTMGPEGAALACQKFFPAAKYIIPMHYGTFPLLTGTWDNFKAELEKRGVPSKLVATDEIKDDPSKIMQVSAEDLA